MKNTKMNSLNKKQLEFQKRISSYWNFKLFFLKFIPSLFFWNAKILHLDSSKSIISIPYNWRNKNPFRSIYFGTQAGAAELSTGILALLATHSFNISTLVTGIDGQFYKKATSLTKFYCNDGDKIFAAVQKALETGEGQTITALAKGFQKNNELVSEFKFTWSFKVRKKR